LICRRLLSAWHDDHIWSVTNVISAIRNGNIVDRYLWWANSASALNSMVC